MAEQLPKSENPERRARLIELLRAKGVDDAEVKQLFLEWRMSLEAAAQDPGVGKEGEIGLMLACAGLYEEAGFISEAVSELQDAKEMAYRETDAAQDEATYNKFLKLFDEIDARLARLGG